MNRPKVLRALALLALLVLVLVACGQKSGVRGTFAGGTGPGGTGTGPGGIVPGATGPGGTGPGGTGPGGTGPGGTGPGGTGPGGTGPGTVITGPGDRTGITPTTITIGIHAPVTGAAPVEPEAFRAGTTLYWKWLHEIEKKKVLGREVKVLFEDDQYTPTTAVAVCNKMASQGAFLLIGGAGTDQINACAGFAEQRGIPYLSPGVQEAGLKFRRTYYAVTMSYAGQMPLLVDLLNARKGKEVKDVDGDGQIKLGHIRPNTPNFNDAADALKNAATAAGFGYKVYTVVKEGSTSEAKTVATQMEQDDVDVAIPITAPTFTFQLAASTGTNNYKPLYAGVAVSNNINQLIRLVCDNNQYENALHLSPWAGWREVMSTDRYDPDFREAADTYAKSLNNTRKGGDILLALWGISKAIHQMLLKAGESVSRESFNLMMDTFRLDSGVFPNLKFNGTPFGAQNVFVLRGDCEAAGSHNTDPGHQWVTHPDYPDRRNSF